MHFHLCSTAFCWWYLWVNALKDRASVISMSVSFSLTHHKGELQRSCSRSVAEKVSEQCQLACHCRRYPPLPPPPPPPPPPRLLGNTGKPPWSLSWVSHLSCSKSVCLTLSALTPQLDLIPSQTQRVKQLSSLQELFWREVFPFMHRVKMCHQPSEISVCSFAHVCLCEW